VLADDTIAAISTAAGSSPRAIVRLSGPAAFPILAGLLAEPRVDLSVPPSYSAFEVSLQLRAGGPRIPASLYLMPGPRSYTREDVAEVHTLGATPLLRLVLDAVVERGARLAEPGEFTRRAFLAGRIDLAQAEAVLAVIQATTEGELRAATRALRGLRSGRVHALHDTLMGLRAQVEASIDFAEHDIALVTRGQLAGSIDEALALVDEELRNADAGALPPEGIRVALCGLPNAGKSSLFNALVAEERAIVTDVPGTTRDAIAEPLLIDGIRFRLYDTAGMARGASDPGAGPLDAVDAEAVARAVGLIAGTHIALVVVDASRPIGAAEGELWAEIRAPHKILVLSKCDLPCRVAGAEAEALAEGAAVARASAVTGEGLASLRHALTSLVRGGHVEASPSDLVWNARHREALRRARGALRRARRAAVDEIGSEFVAADLRDAHDALGALTGQAVAEDILDVIFAEFCVGK